MRPSCECCMAKNSSAASRPRQRRTALLRPPTKWVALKWVALSSLCLIIVVFAVPACCLSPTATKAATALELAERHAQHTSTGGTLWTGSKAAGPLSALPHLSPKHAAFQAESAAVASGMSRAEASAASAVAAMDDSLTRLYNIRYPVLAYASQAALLQEVTPLIDFFPLLEEALEGELVSVLQLSRRLMRLLPKNVLPTRAATLLLHALGAPHAGEPLHSLLIAVLQGSSAKLSGCLYSVVVSASIPALPHIPPAAEDEAALEHGIVSALDSIQGPIGEIDVTDSFRHVGNPLYPFLYRNRPARSVMTAYRRMLYRAFPKTLVHVADHLRPMYADARGEVPVLGLSSNPTWRSVQNSRPCGGHRCRVRRKGRPALHADASTQLLRQLAAPEGENRSRVAIVDYHMTSWHPVLKAFGGVLGRLDPHRFIVRLYSLNPVDVVAADEFLSLGADIKVVNISSASIDEQRAKVSSWAPHVVVFTALAMSADVDRLAMSRLAPMQVLLHGHGTTFGYRTIDVVIPVDDANAVSTEQYEERWVSHARSVGTIRPFPVLPTGSSQRTRADFGLPEHATLLVCAQTAFKIHPRMDGVFEQLLARDANSVVVLIATLGRAGYSQLLMRRLQPVVDRSGGRLVMLPTVSTESGRGYDLGYHYLDLLAVCDIALDSHPFTGGTSTLESLSVGLPVVTLPGREPSGRISQKYLHHVDMHSLIASTWDEYVEIVVRLSHDRSLRSRFRNKLRSRSRVLFDNVAVVSEYNDKLERIASRARVMARIALEQIPAETWGIERRGVSSEPVDRMNRLRRPLGRGRAAGVAGVEE